jgi:hypothetical protein
MTIGYATARNISKRSNNVSQQPSYRALGLTNPTIGMTASNATTQTGQKKFGTASMLVSTNSGYIGNSSGNYTWWPSGTGPWTIQWWQYIPTAVSSGTSRHICSNEETSGGLGLRFGTSYNSGGLNNLNIFARGQLDMQYWGITWTRDVWQFVSVCRNGTNVYMHVDGVSLGAASGGSGAGTRNFVATSGFNKIQIGNAGDVGLNGIYIDDFQVFQSTALYTNSSYSVPTTEATLQIGTTACFNMNGINNGTSFPNVTS